MKKLIKLTVILFIICSAGANAQQSPQYTQYMYNEFVINPAIAGTLNSYQIRSCNRFQWVGVEDAPITNTLSFYGPDAKRDMGYGGYVYHDVTGPTSQTEVSGSYAYNIALNPDIRLSMGMALGIKQFRVDGTQLTFDDGVEDPHAPASIMSSLVPDAAIGVYMYSSNFNVGFAANQLFNNKLNLVKGETSLNRLRSHFFLTGGYKYFFNRTWAVEPSAIIKGMYPVQIQAELNAKVIYRNMVWGSLSFRTHDAVSVILGYNFKDKFIFGYSYDLSVSKFSTYNNGSHEIMIGYKFNSMKNGRR